MKYLFVSALVFMMLYGLSLYTYAGNQQNSSNTGKVTVIVTCNTEVDPDVEESQAAIKLDTCTCNVDDVDWGDIACDGSLECSECIASLLRVGLTTNFANGYYDSEDDETMIKYTLTGNSGSFIDRIGGCPCI